MLTYHHIFNENIDYPFHIHILDSDYCVQAYKNGCLIANIMPNAGTGYSFNKFYTIEQSILELIVTGSRKSYGTIIDKSIFKTSNAKFVRNSSTGLFLTHKEGNYYWSAEDRSLFFFNPYYFSSRFLWEYSIGYIPNNIEVLDLWQDSSLFTNNIYDTDEFWAGMKTFEDVDPVKLDPFSNLTTGLTHTFTVNRIINELQDLKDGDILKFVGGPNVVEVEVKNTYTKALYNYDTVTTRPIITVPITIINPNKKVTIAKNLEPGSSEITNLVLYNNNITIQTRRI